MLWVDCTTVYNCSIRNKIERRKIVKQNTYRIFFCRRLKIVYNHHTFNLWNLPTTYYVVLEKIEMSLNDVLKKYFKVAFLFDGNQIYTICNTNVMAMYNHILTLYCQYWLRVHCTLYTDSLYYTLIMPWLHLSEILFSLLRSFLHLTAS